MCENCTVQSCSLFAYKVIIHYPFRYDGIGTVRGAIPPPNTPLCHQRSSAHRLAGHERASCTCTPWYSSACAWSPVAILRRRYRACQLPLLPSAALALRMSSRSDGKGRCTGASDAPMGPIHSWRYLYAYGTHPHGGAHASGESLRHPPAGAIACSW